MKRVLPKIVGWLIAINGLLYCLSLFAQEPVSPPLKPAAQPEWAVIRIKSHGASATIVWTTNGKSWILGCAHMLEGPDGKPSAEMRAKKFVIDGPGQPYAPKKLAEVRLLAYDHSLDLSLLEIDNGPFNYIPVAPAGHKASKNVRSMGYDNMSWPITNHFATILSVEGITTFTREKPWHGRSGGGLIDCENRYLIGVVQGYEVAPAGRGLYVSHGAIVGFISKYKPDLLIKAATPDPWPLSRKLDPAPRPKASPSPFCPPGRA